MLKKSNMMTDRLNISTIYNTYIKLTYLRLMYIQ